MPTARKPARGRHELHQLRPSRPERASERAKGNAWDFVFVNAAYGPGGKFRDFCPTCIAAGEIDRFCAALEARAPFIPLQRRPALRLVTTEKETSA